MYRLFFILVLFLATLCSAEQSRAEKYRAGEHYRVLPEPVATGNPQKIEVVEVFWYGCKYCYRLTTRIGEWMRQLPEDVDYERLPAIWHPQMGLHAQAYYVAEQMSVLDKMHPKLFDAMHATGLKLKSEREIRQLFVAAGVDGDEFTGTFTSFGIRSKVLRAEQRSRAYLVIGTPCIVINGKYLVTVESAGDRNKMLAVAGFLIEKERQQH